MEKTDDNEDEEAKEVEAEDGAEDSENKVENVEDQKEQTEEDGEQAEDEKKKVEADAEEEPTAPVKKKAGLNMGGVVIAILGVLGLIGAVLWDPFMNILESKHAADINIGSTQIYGIVAAVLVLLVGVMIIFAMRKKTTAS